MDDDTFEHEDDDTNTESLRGTRNLSTDTTNKNKSGAVGTQAWQEEESEGQLSVDVYQTPGEIIVQSMVAGVRPEDLSINITRDMITIRGKREENRIISDDNYFTKELYWGSFSRTILLPQEIDPEEAEAIEKHGLLIIKLPKMDKGRQTSLKVKSL